MYNVQCTFYANEMRHIHVQYTTEVQYQDCTPMWCDMQGLSICLQLRQTNTSRNEQTDKLTDRQTPVSRRKCADARCQVKKHIKSGRDLCQFSSGDLEAKLGIRHVLHRKKVFISFCAFPRVAGSLSHTWLYLEFIEAIKSFFPGVPGSLGATARKFRSGGLARPSVGHQVILPSCSSFSLLLLDHRCVTRSIFIFIASPLSTQVAR